MAKKKLYAKSADISGKAFAYTIAAFVLALVLLYFSSRLIPRQGMVMLSAYAREYATLQLLLSSINVALILYLFYIYAKDYLELHSKFTGGLLLFLAAMLLFSLTSNPLVAYWFGFRMGAALFNLVPLAFSTIALVVLARISAE